MVLPLVVGLGACSRPEVDRPEPRDPGVGASRQGQPEPSTESLRGRATEPGQEGPAPIWSTAIERNEQRLAQVGDLVIVPDDREIRAVQRSTGQDRWRHTASGYQLSVADGLLVVSDDDGDSIEVLDAATGASRWRAEGGQDVTVYRQAVYSRDCVGTGPSAKCNMVARDVRDGRRLWSLPVDRFARVTDVVIGARQPYAPTAGTFLAVRPNGKNYLAVRTGTGRAAGGRLPNRAWYGVVAGDLLVTTDNDPPRGDRRCTVSIATVDAATGARRWSGAVYSGRRQDGECEKRLANYKSDRVLIGAGTRLAAVTATGLPQVVDLRTGKTVWTGADTGVPIDGDDRSVLVRDSSDAGALTLLDLATGAPRWSAPDPGLSGRSASWRSAVTGGLLAISGAVEDRPFVLVYEIGTGRQLGRYPGWLAGTGDDWVAVSHSGGEDLILDFHTF